jgi:hypothetical protein
MFRDQGWCLDKIDKEELALLFIVIFLAICDTTITGAIIYYFIK